jgi:hypothetical protein
MPNEWIAWSVLPCLFAFTGRNVAQPGGANSSSHVMMTPEAIHCQPIPKEWTAGPPPAEYSVLAGNDRKTEVAIIEGDPTKDNDGTQ